MVSLLLAVMIAAIRSRKKRKPVLDLGRWRNSLPH
jgi:hypothetical protein